MKKKLILIISIIIMMVFAVQLTSCSRKEALPETTGEELGVYVLNDKFVDENAEEICENGVPVYRFDDDGNVVTKGEKKDVIVIAAKNVTYFTCINEANANDKDTRQFIPVYVLSDGSEVYGTVTWEMPVNLAPSNAVNSKITFETTDENTVYFNDGEKKLEFDGTEPIVLKLTGCYSGKTAILVTNCLDEIVSTIDITITAKESTDKNALEEIEAKVSSCEHEYEDTVVAATETTEGYTQHTCKKCGHVYRDNYTEKLPCTHTFTEREVKATCKEQGYTLCTCSKCGYTKKTNTTPLAEHTYRDEIVPSTCKEQGYTKHTCTVCGHIEKDTYTELAKHNYRVEIVPSTCSEQGYKLHTCTACGSNYKDDYTAKKDHTFIVNTVAPTYTEKGYTNHTCNVCGYNYKDNYVEKLVCASHSYAETSRREATCTSAGSVTKTCARCGQVTTETIPALGHKYSETIVQPTCTAKGYTTHTCTVCGSSYTDTYIPALGHEWEGHEEQRQVGSDVHNFCNVCGIDLTANGISAAAHTEQHLLAGEGGGWHSGLVPIYDWVTIYVCQRCGATQQHS